MNRSQSAKQIITLLLVFLLACAPFAGQVNALTIATVVTADQDEADEDGVTFDNLLAASSYILYVEARNIGQQVRSGGLSELIEPLLPVAGQLPKELDMLARFVVTNADTLSRSRLMIAAQPAKPSLPEALIVLELASADAAQEFQGKIQELLVSMLSPASSAKADASKTDASKTDASKNADQPALPSPFIIKRAGRLLAFSPTPFTFKGLRAENDKPISDDPNFRAAHDRFYSETLFLYYDMSLSARIIKGREEAIRKQVEGTTREALKNQYEAQGRLSEFEKLEAQRNSSGQVPPPPAPASPATPLAVNETPVPAAGAADRAPALEPQPDPDKRLAGATAAPPSTAAASSVAALKASSKPAPSAPSPGRRAGEGIKTNVEPAVAPPPPMAVPGGVPQESQGGNSDYLGNILAMVISRGMTNVSSPDAAALALTLENDSLIIRALIITPQGVPFGPIPFIPLLVSGPAQASGAASYLPADTDIFVTASLDLPLLYDTALGMFGMFETSPYARGQKTKEPSFESKIAAFEKANGFKIRDEIAATLGNEVAVGIPARYLAATPVGRVGLNSQTTQSGPVVLVSVRDKEALRSKLRPVLEATGLKSPNEKGLVEKRGDIEINSYSRVSMAFIDSYLVIGGDTATIRRVIDARAKNETLATSRDFHSYMQWQPRETLAQGYVSGLVLKDFFKNARTPDSGFDEESRKFLARYSFEPEPITYLAASDVLGPLYELRIPKNLLMRVFAEISVDEMRQRIPRNEADAWGGLNSITELEKAYKAEHGRYGSPEELEEVQMIKDYMERYGYKFDLVVSGNRYEATATPTEYGKTGRLSFYTDQSGVVREGDHGGRPATAADKKSNSSN